MFIPTVADILNTIALNTNHRLIVKSTDKPKEIEDKLRSRKFNVSNTTSHTSFAGIISEDSWAFGHKEDLGFSIFLDRRSQ